MATKTCKVCGELKEAARGTWVVVHDQPLGRICLSCKAKANALRNKVSRATELGKEYARNAVLVSAKKVRSTPSGRLAHNTRNLAWAKANPAKQMAWAMLRHATKLKRTPSWADKQQIALVYQKAVMLTKSTGIRHAVDHVIPLRGKLVSGLHVHNNLQVITFSENAAKGNKFDVGCE